MDPYGTTDHAMVGLGDVEKTSSMALCIVQALHPCDGMAGVAVQKCTSAWWFTVSQLTSMRIFNHLKQDGK